MDTSKNFIQWNCVFTGQRPSLFCFRNLSKKWWDCLRIQAFHIWFQCFHCWFMTISIFVKICQFLPGNGLRFLPIVDLKQNNQMGSKLSKYIISIEKSLLCNLQWFQYLAKALRCYQFEGLSMRTANFDYQKKGHSSFPSKQHKQSIKEKINLNLIKD